MDEDQSTRDLLRLFNLTREEANPRVVAIVCAAYIEDHVTTLIRRKLPGLQASLTKRLFEAGRGPLGTAVGKIDMAEALGVFTPEMANDARQIANIRNRFAHKLGVDSFEHELVRGSVENLSGAKLALREGWTLEKIFREAAIGLCSHIMMEDLGAPVVELHE